MKTIKVFKLKDSYVINIEYSTATASTITNTYHNNMRDVLLQVEMETKDKDKGKIILSGISQLEVTIDEYKRGYK